GLVDHQRRGVRQVEAAISFDHRDPDAGVGCEFRENRLRQSRSLRAENEHVALAERGCIVAALAARRHGKEPSTLKVSAAGRPVRVEGDIDGVVVVQSSSVQLPVANREPERPHEVQPAAGVGAQADDISGIGWNLRLVEHDLEPGQIRAVDGHENMVIVIYQWYVETVVTQECTAGAYAPLPSPLPRALPLFAKP